MGKIIGMIPARLGSERVPKKNLRLLGDKPLVSYIIEASLAARILDEIYLNSEADIFAGIAKKYRIKFYKRPVHLSSNKTVNDEFLLDFVKNVKGDIIVQLLPTSPLITAEEIKSFVCEMISSNYDTLVSVNNHQIACVYEGKPLNFNYFESHKSSQDMVPVQSYAGVLMAWKYSSFLNNMNKYGCGYHGGEGRTGYYVLSGLSTIDIDHEDDFILAEVALKYKHNKQNFDKKYYTSQKD